MEGDYFEEDNDTLCEYAEWGPSYSLVPVLYMVIFILGLSGNGLVIITVWKSESKRRATDVYIGHLALADLTFVVTLPLWAVYTAFGYHWPFGVALCKISSYVVLLNMYASVFCLTCMSFDRYLAIVRPLPAGRPRSKGTMLGSLGAIWLLSVMLASPTLLFRTTLSDSHDRIICGMDFSPVMSRDDPGQEGMWIAGLSLSSTLLGFLLPFLAMTICYCFIGRAISLHFGAVHKEGQRRRRLLKIISALVAVFAVCWAPFHMLKTADALSYLQLAPNSCSFLSWLLMALPYATCLAYVNSCLNPFLYAFFDLRFRTQCLRLLRLSKDAEAPVSSQSSQGQKCEGHTVATKV